jgi:hypothetical protein
MRSLASTNRLAIFCFAGTGQLNRDRRSCVSFIDMKYRHEMDVSATIPR